MDINNYSLSRQLGLALQAKGLKLTLAESCTAGGASAEITRVPGSSQWFDCGFVTYSNEAKAQLLGIKTEIIQQHGAVSEEVARAMALGALKNSQADIAASITGIAGPGGGSVEKPVGLVWFGIAQKNDACECRHVLFAGGREHIRQCAIAYILTWLNESAKRYTTLHSL